jgi:hypothetical protein
MATPPTPPTQKLTARMGLISTRVTERLGVTERLVVTERLGLTKRVGVTSTSGVHHRHRGRV